MPKIRIIYNPFLIRKLRADRYSLNTYFFKDRTIELNWNQGSDAILLQICYLRLSAKICVLLRINEILDFVPGKKYIESICARQSLLKDSTCEVNNDGPEL